MAAKRTAGGTATGTADGSSGGQENAQQGAQLEKRLSPVNLLSLALGCIIGWGAFVMPGNTFLGSAGPVGTAIAMLVAACVLSVIALNYSHMIRRFPVAGGEFVYARRAFGNVHAFICSWFLVLSYLVIVPLNATALALIGHNLLNGVFEVGPHYTVAGYTVYATELALALAVLVLFALLSIRGTKLTGVFQTILVAVLLLGVFGVVIGAFGCEDASWDNLRPFFGSNGSAFGGVLAVVAVAPWAFVGFDTVPQATEELNFSTGKTRAIMIASIFFGAFVYAALTLVTASVVPEGYASWDAYIADLDNLSGLIALPTFYAAYEIMGEAGVVLLALAACGAILSGIVGFYMSSSRLLLSLAREGFLPEWFGRLGRHNTPSHALVFVMLLSFVPPFFGRTVLGWVVDMSSLGAAFGYAYTSAAAFKFARVEGKRGEMVAGALGTALGICFIVLLLVPIPGLSSSLGPESMAALAIWVVLGVVFYNVSRKRRSMREVAQG